MKLTPEQLREIEERAEKATRGPWRIGKYTDLIAPDQFGGEQVVAREIGTDSSAKFIVSSRTDIPRLLAHIAVLEGESKKFRLILSEVASTFHMTNLSYEERMRKMEQIARDAVYDYHEGTLLKGADNR